MQESPLQFPDKLRVLSTPAKSPKSPRVRTVKADAKPEAKSPQRIRQNHPQRFRSPQPNRRGPPAESKLESKESVKRRAGNVQSQVIESPRKPPIPSPRAIAARRRSLSRTPGEKFSVKVAIRTRPLNDRETANK